MLWIQCDTLDELKEQHKALIDKWDYTPDDIEVATFAPSNFTKLTAPVYHTPYTWQESERMANEYWTNQYHNSNM